MTTRRTFLVATGCTALLPWGSSAATPAATPSCIRWIRAQAFWRADLIGASLVVPTHVSKGWELKLDHSDEIGVVLEISQHRLLLRRSERPDRWVVAHFEDNDANRDRLVGSPITSSPARSPRRVLS